MASTLEIQEKLNELLENANKLVEELSDKYKDQVDLLEELTKAAEEMIEALDSEEVCNLSDCFEKVAKTSDNARTNIKGAIDEIIKNSGGAAAGVESLTNRLSGATGRSNELDKSFSRITASAKQAGSAMGEMANKANEASSSGGALSSSSSGVSDAFGMVATAATGGGAAIVAGIGKAFSFVTSAASSLVSFLGTIGSTIFTVAKALIGFPLAVLDGLLGYAQQGGGSSPLAEALREIQIEFGYLNKTAGYAIVNLSKNMSGQLANTGLSVRRIFGGVADVLKYFTEYAKNLGETVDAVFRDLKASGAEALAAFNKALGFTAAGQKGVAQRALATGQELNDLNREIANYSIQLSSAFGVSMKLVSRDVGEMMADFEHFGSVSVKEMTQAAVFARRLGIEVKSLGKLVDKFLNFEDAANSAAQLSQAFGLNVDAFKLMSEQDPAKKLQMLRDGFFATGRTIENMTAQERRLLATQTGLGESELALAFSQKNRSLTYDQIKKKGDSAQKSQLTQAQALEKLAGAIERLVGSGNALQGGFLDVFIQGFVKGVTSTREFRDIIRALSRSLMIVFRAGIQVGDMFVRLFPGVRDVMIGIKEMFNPSFMTSFMNKVKAAFRNFFSMMTTDPTTALPVLLGKLQEAFTDRFSASGPGASRVFEGIKKFLKAVYNIFVGVIREAFLGLGSTIAPLISSIFSDRTFAQATTAAGGAVGGIGSAISTAFTDVFGTSGSPQRQAMLDSLGKFGDAIKDGLYFIGIKLVNAAADLIIMIGDALSGGENNAANVKKGTQSMGEKFSKNLSNAFERSKPALNAIGGKILEYIGMGMLWALGKLGAFVSEGILQLFVGLPASITALIYDSLAGLIKYITVEIPASIIRLADEALGSNSGFAKGIRFVMSLVAFFGSTLYVSFKTIAAFFANIGQFIEDIFKVGPAQAFENMLVNINRAIDNAKRPLIQSLNSIRRVLGLSEIPLPPPANNPAVQAINQAVDASRTGGAEINRNLTEGLTLPTAAAARAAAPASVSDQVSSIRETIQSAREVGRIDQQAAQRSMEKLQQFATALGPILTNTQTALNDALRGVDINKMNENVESIKSIIDNVSKIQQLTSRRTEGITSASLVPIQNSITALSNFLSGATLVQMATAFNAVETTARISGIENTTNSISSMVQAINSTSAELARVSPINIQTNLNRLAANLGLGNNATYTITNRNFTINVNVDVHMDAAELEKTLVERKGTRIQHTK